MKSVESACFTGVHSRPFWNFLSAGPCTKTLCGVTHGRRGRRATQAAMIFTRQERAEANSACNCWQQGNNLSQTTCTLLYLVLCDDHQRNPNFKTGIIWLGDNWSQTAHFCQLQCTWGENWWVGGGPTMYCEVNNTGGAEFRIPRNYNTRAKRRCYCT